MTANMVGGSTLSSSKVINIDNSGPVVTLSATPAMVAPFVIDNVNTFTLTSAYVSGPAISIVYYYMDLTSGTTLLGTSTTAPYSVSFSATSLALYTLVTLRAVAQSSTGAQAVTTMSGIVNMPNLAPTGISMAGVTTSGLGVTVLETATGGTVVATLSASDPNAGDSHTYAVLTSGSPFTTLGSSLTVATGAHFNYAVQSSYTFTLQTTDQGGLSWSGSYTVYITHVNLPPTAISLSSTTVSAAASVNSIVGTFSVTDRDSSSFTMVLTSSGSGSFFVSGMNLYVAKTLNYYVSPTVTITVQATDSNALSYSTNIAITVSWVNSYPTFINVTNLQVTVSSCAWLCDDD